MPTAFRADLASTPRPLHHRWQWCVGSDHATMALRADWQAQLTRAHRDLGFGHVRFHGLLDDAMGTLIMQNGQLLYSFFNADTIFDFLVSIGMKPVVELSFMPRTLSSGNDIVFHYQGNVTPPRDLAQWGELVRRLAEHWVDRYGIDEVASWPIEVWNEPNLRYFWTGDQAAYFALYDAAARAVKSVDARLQVGGPATAENAWLPEFVAHCAGAGSTEPDFISTHYYPTDAFGQIDNDTVTQLEHAPRDIMRSKALEARAAVGSRPLYYTEWSISSNPRDTQHDSSLAAALAVRIALSVDDVVDGYSYWTFSDLFEENYFPSVPFHGGFGMMNLHGIPKPIYRAFELVRRLGDRLVTVSGEHPTLCAWVGEAAALVVNQAMPRHPIADEAVTLTLTPAPGHRLKAATLSRVDEGRANPAGAWQRMGSPEYLKPAEVAALMAASQLVEEAIDATVEGGDLRFDFVAAPQSVNLLRLDWEAA